MEANLINAGALAYLGDSVYEVEIRNYLVLKGINNANKLQKEAVKYVSAYAQADILEKLINEGMLNEDELYTVGRARNYKPNSKPKHTDIVTYKKATALEALFGMLYINKDTNTVFENNKKKNCYITHFEFKNHSFAICSMEEPPLEIKFNYL